MQAINDDVRSSIDLGLKVQTTYIYFSLNSSLSENIEGMRKIGSHFITYLFTCGGTPLYFS